VSYWRLTAAAAVLAAAALVLAVASFDFWGDKRCTLIGCGRMVEVVVDQPGERPLEACVGPNCSTTRGNSLEIWAGTERDTVHVVVRVAGGGDEVARTRTELRKSWPNGKRCGPPCKSARLRLTVDDQLVPA